MIASYLSPTSGHYVMIGLLATIIAGTFALRSRGWFGRIILVAITLTFMLPTAVLAAGKYPWLVDSRYRTFKVLYWSIGKGMSREEVLKTVGYSYPPGEKYLRPIVIEDSSVAIRLRMNPENIPDPKREGITVRLEAGMVVGKDYTSD